MAWRKRAKTVNDWSMLGGLLAANAGSRVIRRSCPLIGFRCSAHNGHSCIRGPVCCPDRNGHFPGPSKGRRILAQEARGLKLVSLVVEIRPTHYPSTIKVAAPAADE